MAGILANSAAVTMVSASSPEVKAGFVTKQQVTLTADPVGSAYSWGQAIPAGSVSAFSALTSTVNATTRFTPDVAGEYVITCDVDGTFYTLRMTVVAVTAVPTVGGTRYLPVADASVPAPSNGETVFYSSGVSRLRVKASDDSVRDLDPGARVGSFTLSSGTATISDTSVTANTVVVAQCTSETNRGTLTWANNVGTSLVATSSDGADASSYIYALIG